MIGRRLAIARILGIEIRVDLGCVAVSLLVWWTLATGLFPQKYYSHPDAVYWLMGLVGTMGLVVSIILHELSHAVVARWLGIPIEGITLFMFGGVAEMGDEPHTPGAELLMAGAGPLMSILLALGLFGMAYVGDLFSWPSALEGLIEYLSAMNAILAAFNLVPAFPLDGGRILRAALWAWRKSLSRATRIAARTGAFFSYIFMGLGVVDGAHGDLVGGLWWVLIGAFVRIGSETSYRQLLLRRELAADRRLAPHEA